MDRRRPRLRYRRSQRRRAGVSGDSRVGDVWVAVTADMGSGTNRWLASSRLRLGVAYGSRTAGRRGLAGCRTSGGVGFAAEIATRGLSGSAALSGRARLRGVACL